jgi:hypothetical protein
MNFPSEFDVIVVGGEHQPSSPGGTCDWYLGASAQRVLAALVMAKYACCGIILVVH